MISEFIGHFGQDLNIKNPLAYEFRDDSFVLSSSLKIWENHDWVATLHGQVFKENFNRNPQSFFEKISLGLKEDPNKIHQSLDGTYFIIFYFKKDKKLFLLNNRYQASTCYYTDQPNSGFCFSNNLFSLSDKLRESAPLKAHLGSIQSFLSNGFTMTDQTQIQGIKKVLPCFRVIASKPGYVLEEFAKSEYFFDRKPIGNLEDSLKTYEEIYQKGIRQFLEETNPKEVGTLLSGGHDTSFAMIQATKVHKNPIHAFTVTFPGWAWDESEFAKNICEKSGGIFHPVEFGPSDLDYIVSMAHGNQEPVVGSSLPLHKLSLFASQKVGTLLGGDGGDTLWGEYYPVGEYHRFTKSLPLSFKKAIHQFSKTARKLTDWERFWELEHVSELFCSKNPYDDFMRRLCTYRHFKPEFLNNLLVGGFNTKELPPSAYQVPFTKNNFQEALIYGKLYNAFYTYQSFSTYRSVEHFGTPFYLPTINKDLIRFIGELPYNWLNGGTFFHRLTNNKMINRRFHKMALAKYLKREEIYNRSFDIPWYKILKPRTEVLKKLLFSLKDRGWYKEEYLDMLFNEFEQQEAKEYELLELKHHGYRIFTLLSLEVWSREVLDGRRTAQPDRKIPLEEYF